MIEISNVRVELDQGDPANVAGLSDAAARALGIVAKDVRAVSLQKRSVDARRKSDVHFVATLAVELTNHADEQAFLSGTKKLAPGVSVKEHRPFEPLDIPDLSANEVVDFNLSGRRPVVVGFGPAGVFAALYLAEAGLKPIVLERGGDVDERIAAVRAFDEGGPLDSTTNIQFGAGGAGTFSDGKLTTGTKSPLQQQVLHWFVRAGAPTEILWQAKPHIGTDKLVGVVESIRDRIVELGGDVRFHTQFVGLTVRDGRLATVQARETRPDRDFGGVDPAACGMPAAPVYSGVSSYSIPATTVILACGHSARDTFQVLKDAGLHLQQKPFSMGVRIEHRQDAINRAQYGPSADNPALSAADYKLVQHLPNGRGAYTFCMCPGGTVVCAASEPDSVVVNGMSSFARDGENANAALLVGVEPSDFDSDDPLAGIDLQRRVEQAAFRSVIDAGGKPYQAPAQTVGDFLTGSSGTPSKSVRPTYARGVAWCDLRECLPDFVSDAISQALPLLGRKLKGFDDADAVMTGVETRSSSPVRIVRDKSFCAVLDEVEAYRAKQAAGGDAAAAESENVSVIADEVDEALLIARSSRIYPCGEGAGYAGGIMSAAVDGLRVAMALAHAAQVAPPAREEEDDEAERDILGFDWTDCPVD